MSDGGGRTCFKIPVALLTVSKAIHEEAMDILFGENRLVLEFGGVSRSDQRREEDPNQIQPIGFLQPVVLYLAECADFHNLDLAVDGTGMLYAKLLQYDLVAATRPTEKFFGADSGGGLSLVRQFRAFCPRAPHAQDQLEAKVNGTPKATALLTALSQPATMAAERVENFEDGNEVEDDEEVPPSERNPRFPTNSSMEF
ncbi:hypothetical protein DFJ73DRAFT_774662 [Zopfochytrium polystomum]|nr:hypothetical protein DFJ73DRAFT_774662 [Zopfochytrium polystomum]